MESALIGFVGILIGALMAEYFRRRNRIEIYSQKVFERRLGIYEELMHLVQEAYQVACEVLENAKLSPEERTALVFPAGLLIAEYTDKHTLYIDSYVGADASAFMLGVDDISSIDDPIEKEAKISAFRGRYKTLKQLIIKESGVHQGNKHFRQVSQSRPDSTIIRRIKELEKQVELRVC